MVFIALFLISLISITLVSIVTKKIKIPSVLFLILIGILLGGYGLYDFFGKLNNINPNVNELSTLATYAIIILFLVSGMQLNIPAIKQSGKKTLGLSLFPVYIEGLIMGFIAYLIFLILPLEEFKFGLINFLMVMSVFAMASPAIIIPINMKAKAIGKKQSIFDEMTVASVLDNFLPFPLMIIWIIVGLNVARGEAVTGFSIISSLLVALIMLVIAYVVGHICGYLMGKLSKLEFLNSDLLSILTIVLTVIIVILLGPIGASYGILTGFGVGLGFNIGASNLEKKLKVSVFSSKIYGMFFMPLVFIYVGTQIRIDMLLNPITIISMAIITILSITIKGTISSKYLVSKGSTKEEGKLSSYLFAAKGIILINISLVLNASYTGAGLENVLQYMYILAAVSILISIPYSMIKAEKLITKM